MTSQKTILTRLALVAAVSLSAAWVATGAVAQDKTQDQAKDQTQARVQDRTQDQIYGSQLMTQVERNEYRAKMRSMKTSQERDALRLEHHKLMQERAQVKGITLPAEPLARGAGAGIGPGAGVGAGAGMGAGPGAKK
ncbi:MAG: hypothetical protein PHQ58_06400 [Rhodoferax sp.]|uniref:hypothetical protein n=1 Tax=Rhodoferax sp. TaxID=50421 RepID=UPI002621A3D5|nr:hypothetical protein [Rhodoferax sp.]MDD2880048.1 hypothetical protein [Rhodoferax sp.]